MGLNEEFYRQFIGYDRKNLEEELGKLTESNKEDLLKGYSINSKKRYVKSDDIIFILKKRLSKKLLINKLRTTDKNEINLLINRLTKEERNSLFKEYSLYLFEPKEELTNKEIKNNAKIIRDMRKELGTYGKGTGRKVYKPYYEIFKEPKEEVDHIFLYNTEEEKQLLYKKYDKDFSNTEYREEVTEEDNAIINGKILHNMKRRLASLREGKSRYVKITDLINLDLETIRLRSKNLRKIDYSRLVNYFGEDFSNETIIPTVFIDKVINDYTRDILLGKGKKLKHASSKLIDVLRKARKENETDEQFLFRIREVNKTLDEKARETMFKKYGYGLDEVHDEKEYTTEEKYNIVHIYIPTIKYRLTHEKTVYYIKPFFERFPNTMHETVLKGVERLRYNEIEFLQLLFGEKFDKPITYEESNPKLNSTLNNIVKKVKANILEELKRETGILVFYLKEIQKECELEEFQEIENTYGLAVAEGIVCYLKYKDNISEESLKRLTGLTYNEIKNLLVTDINVLRMATIKK